MYIMYRIQGYVARTVNHDQKVPKHWRKKKSKTNEKDISSKKYTYIIPDQ